MLDIYSADHPDYADVLNACRAVVTVHRGNSFTFLKPFSTRVIAGDREGELATQDQILIKPGMKARLVSADAQVNNLKLKMELSGGWNISALMYEVGSVIGVEVQGQPVTFDQMVIDTFTQSVGRAPTRDPALRRAHKQKMEARKPGMKAYKPPIKNDDLDPDDALLDWIDGKALKAQQQADFGIY